MTEADNARMGRYLKSKKNSYLVENRFSNLVVVYFDQLFGTEFTLVLVKILFGPFSDIFSPY